MKLQPPIILKTTIHQEPLERGRISPKMLPGSPKMKSCCHGKFQTLRMTNSFRLKFVTKAAVCPPSYMHNYRAEQKEKENEGKKSKHNKTRLEKSRFKFPESHL